MSFLINSYRYALAELTELCNHSNIITDMSANPVNIQCTKIDVSSLSSSITIGALGYYGGGSIAGNIALGLYSDDSGSPSAPENILCQTASHAAASGAQILETTTTPSVSHSGLLWIGFVTDPAGDPVDYPQGQIVVADNGQTVSNQSFTYPTFPSPYVIGYYGLDRCRLCLSYR